MGCGSSADKGRQLNQPKNSVPEADSFFPQPTTNSNNNNPKTTATVTNGPAKSTTNAAPLPTPRPTTTAVVPEREDDDRYKTIPVLKKKRAPYIPPAPITALLAEHHQQAQKPKKTSTISIIPPQEDPAAAHPQQLSGGGGSGVGGEEQSLGEDEADFLLHQPSNAKLANDQIEDWGSIDIPPSSGATPEQQQPTEVSDDATVFSEMSYPNETPEPSSKSGMRFNELYRLKGVLGTGAFSTVREGYHRTNGSIGYAVKCINRKKLSEEDEAALLDEVSILKELKHQHIIRLFDFFEESSTYYLVMERMRGGELFDRIVAKAYYNEKEARDTCKIVLEAVKYCHDNHVAHRDLKPENLLLLSDVEDSQVKIADFGFAKKVYTPCSLTTQCGTPGYVAPEILEGTAYDERADMWSVGVILYILLGGYPPFIESTQRDLFRKIRKGEYEFHEEYWGTVSAEAKELISSLLTVSLADRLTASEALENAWICGDDAILTAKNLNTNLEKLRNFNGKRKFRAAVSAIMAANKLNFMGKEFQTPA